MPRKKPIALDAAAVAAICAALAHTLDRLQKRCDLLEEAYTSSRADKSICPPQDNSAPGDRDDASVPEQQMLTETVTLPAAFTPVKVQNQHTLKDRTAEGAVGTADEDLEEENDAGGGGPGDKDENHPNEDGDHRRNTTRTTLHPAARMAAAKTRTTIRITIQKIRTKTLTTTKPLDICAAARPRSFLGRGPTSSA